MFKRAILLSVGVLGLAGCDAATQIAGDAVEGEARNAIVAQCEQVSANAGIAAGRVSQVCQCSADTFLADPDLTIDDVSRERLTAIVNACAEKTSAEPAGSTETLPTEEIGG